MCILQCFWQCVGGYCAGVVTGAMLAGYSLHTLEYVHVSVSLSHERRGDVELILVCPSGTTSVIAATRSLDKYACRHCSTLNTMLLVLYPVAFCLPIYCKPMILMVRAMKLFCSPLILAFLLSELLLIQCYLLNFECLRSIILRIC